MSQLINHPDVVKAKHDLLLVRFTGKPGQTITSKIHAKKDDGSAVWHPLWHSRILRGAMHSGKKWRSALWINAMHFGKKWWIREFELPSIYSFKILFIMLLARYARSAAITNSTKLFLTISWRWKMNLTIACLLLQQVNSEGFLSMMSNRIIRVSLTKVSDIQTQLTRVSIYRNYASLHVLIECDHFFRWTRFSRERFANFSSRELFIPWLGLKFLSGNIEVFPR